MSLAARRVGPERERSRRAPRRLARSRFRRRGGGGGAVALRAPLPLLRRHLRPRARGVRLAAALRLRVRQHKVRGLGLEIPGLGFKIWNQGPKFRGKLLELWVPDPVISEV